MKIYYFFRKGSMGYDENRAHVVVANTVNEAFELVTDNAKDEGADAWIDADYNRIGDYTGENNEPFIVLTDTNDG